MSAVSLGRISTALVSPDHTLAEVSIPATTESLAPHRHEKAQLYLVLEGEYSESARGREFSLGPGSALFRPALLPTSPRTYSIDSAGPSSGKPDTEIPSP